MRALSWLSGLARSFGRLPVDDVGIVKVQRGQTQAETSTQGLGQPAVPVETRHGDGRQPKQEGVVDLESWLLPKMVPESHHASQRFLVGYWGAAVGIRPVLPATLEGVPLQAR